MARGGERSRVQGGKDAGQPGRQLPQVTTSEDEVGNSSLTGEVTEKGGV